MNVPKPSIRPDRNSPSKVAPDGHENFPFPVAFLRTLDNPLPLITTVLLFPSLSTMKQEENVNGGGGGGGGEGDAAEDDDPFHPTGFMTVFSTWSLEPAPIFSRSTSSFAGHLIELERALDCSSSSYSSSEDPSGGLLVSVDHLRTYPSCTPNPTTSPAEPEVMQEDRLSESDSATTNATETAVRSPLDKPLSQLIEEDIASSPVRTTADSLRKKVSSFPHSPSFLSLFSFKVLALGNLRRLTGTGRFRAGMRRPSWNKSQAIQQVISLKALLEGCPDSGDHPAGPGFR